MVFSGLVSSQYKSTWVTPILSSLGGDGEIRTLGAD